MRITCISDTHTVTQPDDLPDADVLIHAGDLSLSGDEDEIKYALDWLCGLPYKLKILIGGNHDRSLFEHPRTFSHWLREPDMRYLNDSLIHIEGLRVYGTPVSRSFGHIRAFAKSGDELAEHYSSIPPCDILITHGPPRGIGDQSTPREEELGDATLRLRSEQVVSRLHVYGHIHGGYGLREFGGVKFANAALLDEAYKPTNKPIVVDV